MIAFKDGETVLFKGEAPGKLTILQWKDKHTSLYGQYTLALMGSGEDSKVGSAGMGVCGSGRSWEGSRYDQNVLHDTFKEITVFFLNPIKDLNMRLQTMKLLEENMEKSRQ